MYSKTPAYEHVSDESMAVDVSVTPAIIHVESQLDASHTHHVPPASACGQRFEHCIIVITRLKNTVSCLVFYFILMMLNLVVMLWEISGGGFHPAIITLECIINFVIVIEVSVGVCGTGKEYFRSYMNIVDFVVSLLCILFFVFYVVTASMEQANYMSELEGIFLAVRFLIQLLRLSLLMIHTRQSARMQLQEEVDFNNVNLECVLDDDGSHLGAATLSNRSGSSSSASSGDEKTGLTAGHYAHSARDQQHIKTSFIHLKPSIYLELQNARAFDSSIKVDGSPTTQRPSLLDMERQLSSTIRASNNNPTHALSAILQHSAHDLDDDVHDVDDHQLHAATNGGDASNGNGQLNGGQNNV